MVKNVKNIDIKSFFRSNVKEITESFYEDSEIKIYINDYLEISFICLIEDLEYLAFGYLSDFPKNCIQKINVDKNKIFIKTNLVKNDFMDILNDKEIIQTCESVVLVDNKVVKNKILIPFNNNRINVKVDYLSAHCDIFHKKDSSLYCVKIVFLDENIKPVVSFDTSSKSAVYKAIGKAKILKDDLLDCIIFINFNIDFEILRKIILSRITFIIVDKKPSFSILRYSQKFGLTFGKYVEENRIDIFTHSSRVII